MISQEQEEVLEDALRQDASLTAAKVIKMYPEQLKTTSRKTIDNKLRALKAKPTLKKTRPKVKHIFTVTYESRKIPQNQSFSNDDSQTEGDSESMLIDDQSQEQP